MTSLSTHFENQFISDLKQAQTIARSDQSGYALGTAMYLGQQSVEKQLKSIVLKLDELLELGQSKNILSSLSHQLYPNIYKLLYVKHIASVAAPYFTNDGMVRPNSEQSDHSDRLFETISKQWEDYSRNPNWKLLDWRISMGVPLDQKELSELNLHHHTYLKNLQESMGTNPPLQTLTNDMFTAPNMQKVIHDDDQLQKLFTKYVQHPSNIKRQNLFSAYADSVENIFSSGSKTSDYSSSQSSAKFSRRLLLDFSYNIVVGFANYYLFLFPHESLGRYPAILNDGRVTTDMYGEYSDYPLYWVFIYLRYELEYLRTNSTWIDRLWNQIQQFVD